MELPIYLDHAATTPLDPCVLDAIVPYLHDAAANPASLHSEGRRARAALDDARSVVADVLGATADECLFTSGGTEAINLAIKGVALAAPPRRTRVLVSSVEHHAALDAADWTSRLGLMVERIPVTPDGVVELQWLSERISTDTLLVCVMHANNETGAIQPVAEVGEVCRSHGALLHVDAVQSLGWIPLSVNALRADLVSLSAHKIYGPKGVGGLYVRRGTRLSPLMHGGGQERGLRPGTVNVPGAVGMAAAMNLVSLRRDADARRVALLRDHCVLEILERVPRARLSSAGAERLPGHMHFLVPGIEGESLLLALDERGVSVSAGAACSSGTVEPSHVLLAMGVPRDVARCGIRISLGRATTEESLAYLANSLVQAVGELGGSDGC